MNLKKQLRRQRVIERLRAYLITGYYLVFNTPGLPGKVYLTEERRENTKQELANLEAYVSGKKKKEKKRKDGTVIVMKDKWYIDIFSVNFTRTKRSDRRKNKGKSRKKMKKVKTTTFVKTVIAQEGMITAYRDGRMGISPKNHIFRMRKDEPSEF